MHMLHSLRIFVCINALSVRFNARFKCNPFTSNAKCAREYKLYARMNLITLMFASLARAVVHANEYNSNQSWAIMVLLLSSNIASSSGVANKHMRTYIFRTKRTLV